MARDDAVSDAQVAAAAEALWAEFNYLLPADPAAVARIALEAAAAVVDAQEIP